PQADLEATPGNSPQADLGGRPRTPQADPGDDLPDPAVRSRRPRLRLPVSSLSPHSLRSPRRHRPDEWALHQEYPDECAIHQGKAIKCFDVKIIDDYVLIGFMRNSWMVSFGGLSIALGVLSGNIAPALAEGASSTAMLRSAPPAPTITSTGPNVYQNGVA